MADVALTVARPTGGCRRMSRLTCPRQEEASRSLTLVRADHRLDSASFHASDAAAAQRVFSAGTRGSYSVLFTDRGILASKTGSGQTLFRRSAILAGVWARQVAKILLVRPNGTTATPPHASSRLTLLFREVEIYGLVRLGSGRRRRGLRDCLRGKYQCKTRDDGSIEVHCMSPNLMWIVE